MSISKNCKWVDGWICYGWIDGYKGDCMHEWMHGHIGGWAGESIMDKPQIVASEWVNGRLQLDGVTDCLKGMHELIIYATGISEPKKEVRIAYMKRDSWGKWTSCCRHDAQLFNSHCMTTWSQWCLVTCDSQPLIPCMDHDCHKHQFAFAQHIANNRLYITPCACRNYTTYWKSFTCNPRMI